MKPGTRLFPAIALFACIGLAVSLAACGGGCDNTGNGEDTTAPSAEASPPGGSTINGSRQVIITFDESMDPASLSIGGTMAGECGAIWSKNVHENDTLTISPTVAWPDGTGTLLINAKDLAGNPLVELSLTYTVDATLPTAAASPVNGSYLGSGQSVVITFDKPMIPATLVLGGNMAAESDGGAWSGGNTTLTISPAASWADGARTFTVDAEDTVGHAVTLSLAYTVGAVAHTVSALYNANGAEWNDYVINDGADEFSASDTACTGSETGGYGACLHGGEMRVVEVAGKSSCTGLTATDALGAFDWTCVVDAGAVKMVSAGLADSKNLSDLLDFTTPGWKDNSVTVLDGGVAYFATVPAAWWTNPLVVDDDGGYLNAAGTIYVVKNDVLTPATGGYIINASSVGLVGQPGVIINGPSAGVYSHLISADGSADARDFLWVEGAVDAAGDDVGVYFREVRFSVLRDVTVEHADTGIRKSGVYLSSCSNNTLTGVTATNDANNTFGISLISSSDNTLSMVAASNNSIGVHFSASSNNTLSGVTASDNTIGVGLYDSSNNTLTGVTASSNSTGVYASSSSNNRLSVVTASSGIYGVSLALSSDNTLSGVTTAHNSTGIYLYSSSDNTFSGVTSANNNVGVYLYDSSNNNRFSGVTVSNNSSGIVLFSASNNVLSGVAASNNATGVYLYYSPDNTLIGATASNNTMGFNIFNSSNNTLAGLTAANNNLGIQVSSSNNYFTELLKVGSNNADCYITNSIYAPTLTDPGLDDDADPSDVETDTVHDGKCVQEGTSDFGSATTGVDMSSSFVGKTYGDAVNSSDTGGAVVYPADPDSFDWAKFENTYRGWGLDGVFDSRSQGEWTTGSGAIWDWSLRLGDTGDAGNPAILGVLSLPTGDDALTHTWSDATTTTLLRNAVEIQGDGLGNENTLCESDETCLYMPNIGSYQGHGSLESAGAFTDGDPVTGITGVTLMKYETNGY